MGASSLSFREGAARKRPCWRHCACCPVLFQERIPRPIPGDGHTTGDSNTRTVARVPSNWIPSTPAVPTFGRQSRVRGCTWRERELCRRLLGWPASESGGLRHRDGGPRGGRAGLRRPRRRSPARQDSSDCGRATPLPQAHVVRGYSAHSSIGVSRPRSTLGPRVVRPCRSARSAASPSTAATSALLATMLT